jgi:hypothetical protein
MASNGHDPSYPFFWRFALRRLPYLAALMALGFTLGLAYRYHFDPGSERTLLNYLRSAAHGMGIAAAVWAVQAAFAVSARSNFGVALRRMSLATEVIIRALVMAAVLTVTVIGLQAVLYAEPLQLHWQLGTGLPRPYRGWWPSLW